MSPRRVLLHAMPPLLHDIFERLLADVPGVELVAAAGPDLSSAGLRTRADVVITTEPAASPHAVAALVTARPATRVLALAADARGGVLHTRTHRLPLDEVGLSDIMALVTAPRRGDAR